MNNTLLISMFYSMCMTVSVWRQRVKAGLESCCVELYSEHGLEIQVLLGGKDGREKEELRCTLSGQYVCMFLRSMCTYMYYNISVQSILLCIDLYLEKYSWGCLIECIRPIPKCLRNETFI